MNGEGKKTYTYDELNSLPANELYELFIENGLVINEELQETFTQEELAALLKSEFYLLCRGGTMRSHRMYCLLAEETQRVYNELTK